MKNIVVKGARQHNLKNIDVDIPRGKLVVITGLSGSGKSSLAFDTLYAEGQRRYVESLSTYARQFLDQMAKPDMDSVEGLSPAISIEQRGTSKNPRSTVGTVTEIYDFLRLLFARAGDVHCWKCEKKITAQSIQQMVDGALQLPEGSRFSIVAPVVRDEAGSFARELAQLRKRGYSRLSIDDELVDLSQGVPELAEKKRHHIDVFVDRLVLKDGIRQRLADSIELAAELAGGIVRISPLDGDNLVFSERFACVECGVTYPELAPRMFSFNNPHGACPACDGMGSRLFFDPKLIVPNPELSLKEGAIEAWERRNAPFFQSVLESIAAHEKIDMYTPWKDLSKQACDCILHGSKGEEIEFVFKKGKSGGRGRGSYTKAFEGVIANLERRFHDYERRRREEGNGNDGYDAVHDEFHRYMRTAICGECAGARLRKESRHVKVNERSITELTALSIKETHEFFSNLVLDERKRAISERIVREVTSRTKFLINVGLDYLTLDRSSGTLSGGEAQRIRLATQIGSALVGVLYILDEPSIGLHMRDNERLLATLRHLRDQGNTVLVVEHDEEMIRAADHVIDMGPRAGVHGGEVIAFGTPEELMKSPKSLTGAYLSGKRKICVPNRRRRPAQQYLTLKGARENNLRDLAARFPVGLLVGVTGVSGSGKSTLVVDTLLPALKAKLDHRNSVTNAFDGIEGVHLIDKVIDIDQAPIGRTPRSNPATYTGLFTHIRDLYAQLPDSKTRGYKPGRYSFNVKGGRCESCQGDGILRIEMHFLPDVFIQCEACNGRRYNRETLEVRYKGRNIADVLDMTVDQARDFLVHIPKIKQRLSTLQEVGLGYLTLGQSATTLSGGEAQRIKLSKELAKTATGHTLYIMDEPTTGLHFDDVRKLLDVLNSLVDQGNTVIVIEHNLDVIKSCDYILDLGPEGGNAGGAIVATGTPEQVAKSTKSHTAAYLRNVL